MKPITNIRECSPQELEEHIKEAIESVCSTPHGIIFMQILCRMCGFDSTSIVLDANGRIEEQATFNCEARRALYIHLRKYIPREQLISIELPELAQNNTEQKQLTTRSKIENGRNSDTGSSNNSAERHPALRTTNRRATARDK